MIQPVIDFSSMSTINAKVEIYRHAGDTSTLVVECTCSDFLEDFTITREGIGRIFGYGVGHKLDLNLIDIHRVIADYLPQSDLTAHVWLGNADTDIWEDVFPTFYIQEWKRDQKTGNIAITAYDSLYYSSQHTFSELNLTAPYTLKNVADAIASLIGTRAQIYSAGFDLTFTNGANVNGDELLRDILDDIAEATQTIYFIDWRGYLVFKQLLTTTDPVITLNKDNYYELNTQGYKQVGAVCRATELGDNIEAKVDTYNDNATWYVTQYVRNNVFWELRDDINDLVDAALDKIKDVKVYEFECDWEGNPFVEIGDKIEFANIPGLANVYSYLLSDVLYYAGTLNQRTEWKYADNEEETATTPTTIREVINQTFAKVDKINKEITLYVGDIVDTTIEEVLPEKIEELTGGLVTDVEGLKAKQTTTEEQLSTLVVSTEGIDQRVQNTETKIITLENTDKETISTIETINHNLSELELTDNDIVASVESLKQTTKTTIDGLNDEINELNNKVSARMTAEEVEIKIEETLSNGVDKVTTATGFTFDDSGLHISKSNSQMSSTLDETGLEVSRSGTQVLTANHTGVNALNLTARQYLSVENIRFETYGYNRMGCYWIGG